MLFSKEKIEKDTEEAIAAFKKKAENEIWVNLAKGIAEIGGDSYSGGAVEKAYMKEKKDGFPHKKTIQAVINGSGSAVGGSNGHEAAAEADQDEDDAEEIGVEEEAGEDV